MSFYKLNRSKGIAAIMSAAAFFQFSDGAFSAPQAPAPVGSTRVAYRPVAFVNETVITPRDLEKRIQLMRLLNGTPATAPFTQQEKSAALEITIDEALQKQETEQYKVKRTEKDVTAFRERMLRANRIASRDFDTKLPQYGLTLEEVNKILDVQLAWERLTGGRFGRDISVSVFEIEQILERMNRIGNIELKYQEIVVPIASAQETPQAVKQIEAVIRRLQKGEPFERLAAENPGRGGGKNADGVNWVPILSLEEPAQKFVVAAGPNAISPVLRTERGLVIMRMLDKKTGNNAAEVKKRVIYAFLPGATVAAANAFKIEHADCDDFTELSDDDGLYVKDYGYVSASELPPFMQEFVQTATKGDLSRPVEESGGMYVGAVCDVRDANVYQDAPAELREQIRGQIFGRKLDLRGKEYIRSLREKATININ